MKYSSLLNKLYLALTGLLMPGATANLGISFFSIIVPSYTPTTVSSSTVVRGLKTPALSCVLLLFQSHLRLTGASCSCYNLRPLALTVSLFSSSATSDSPDTFIFPLLLLYSVTSL